jgi:hypothetical protein
VTFTGLKFNATDTASAAGSMLIALQVGGSNVARILKSGEIRIAAHQSIFSESGGAPLSGIKLGGQTQGSLTFYTGDNVAWATLTNEYAGGFAGLTVRSAVGLTSAIASAADTLLTRKAAANLRFGAADAAAPVAQTLSVQSVVAGTTNTAGANLTLTGSQGTGTGAGGSIIFQVAPAGSSGTAQNALATFLEATSARAFNLYNTTDVTTNFERGFVRWSTNVLEIGTESGGSGGNRNVYLRTVGSILKSAGGSNYAIEAGGVIRYASGLDLIWSNSTNAHTGITSDIGILRASAGVLKISDGSTGTGALESASLKTDAPTGGTAATWKLGTVASVTPTSPDRTIEVDIGGTIYYLAAKTTND